MNIIKVDFQEGKARVLDVINGMYGDITHAHISHLKDMDPKYEMEDIGFVSGLISRTISEHNQLVTDIHNCHGFDNILGLILKHSIFEDCEGIVVGAFLGTTIDIID
jgi:hypothetical protein